VDNMTDIIIFSSSVCSLALFIVGLGLSVRRHGQSGIIQAMKQVFIGITCSGVLFLLVVFHNMPRVDLFIILMIYLVLFWALAFAYIIGIFGLPLTSLRIQILLTVYNSPFHRIREEDLMKKYSLSTMVEQRIFRLETSGEIIKKGKVFFIKSTRSYFVLHNKFLIYLTKIFKPISRS